MGLLATRPATEDDAEFLWELFIDVRASEFLAMGLGPDALQNLLRVQHRGQTEHYRLHYPNAFWRLALVANEPIGALVVDIGREIRLIDISLLGEHRGRGYGTRLVGAVCAAADALGRETVLHVERTNPAERLYERFDFEIEFDDGLYRRMRRRPGQLPSSAGASFALLGLGLPPAGM